MDIERSASLGLRARNTVTYVDDEEESDNNSQRMSIDEEFNDQRVISSSSEEEQEKIAETEKNDYQRFSDRKRTKVQYDKWNSDQEDEEEHGEDSEAGNEDLLMEDDGQVHEPLEPVRKIDKVLDFRKVKVEDEDYEVSEYLIKWNDASYLHVEWKELPELRGIPGYKKVINFINLIQNAMDELDEDDLEDLLIEQEFNRQRLKEYQMPERILDVDEEERYLVKWGLLEYEEATWEDGAVVSELAQDKIDQFLVRQSSTTIPQNSKKYSKAKRNKLILDQQPEYVPNTLRDYQLLGVNWMIYQWVNDQNGILADEMGLGILY